MAAFIAFSDSVLKIGAFAPGISVKLTSFPPIVITASITVEVALFHIVTFAARSIKLEFFQLLIISLLGS